MLLDRISSPADVKTLPARELPALCGELRRELVERVARTGGWSLTWAISATSTRS